MNNNLSPDRALVGELSVQLQEAIQARTNMGVTLRLTEARLRTVEEEVSALKQKDGVSAPEPDNAPLETR